METCVDCLKNRVESTCGRCAGGVCRKCRVFLADEEFPLETVRPDDLKHTYYCGSCNAEVVEPFRAAYDATLEAARQINVLYKDSKSTIRVKRKALSPIRANGSPDREQTLMKLAFEAARANFNSILDVELVSEKKRNHGWQISAWTGVALPADIQSYETERG